MLKIGISACFFHEDPQRAIFKGMTLQYIEQNVAHWLMQRDVLAFMVPSPEGRTRRAGSKATVDAYAAALDALVLMGGSDVCPETYGEKALRPEWNGDRIRDESVILLIKWEASASSSDCSGRGGTDARGDADSGCQADAPVWYHATSRPSSSPVSGAASEIPRRASGSRSGAT